MDKIQEILSSVGVKDFDELTEMERETYFKMLEVAESGKITLEDFKKNINKMRESIDYVLAVEELPKNRDLYLKARLKCYILMEAFFERPARAREMLDQYGKAARNKIK